MADPDRKGGEGLSLRTLVIASAASLTAAMVTSRLFPPGTIYASAVTPVIVTAVSEMLKRPADRVSELRRQRQTLVMQAARAPHGEESAALEGAPDFARGAAADEELAAPNGSGSAPPIKIHGRRRTPLLHPKVWVATGVVAFAIAVAVLTLPELIFGGAVTTSHRTTFFGGGSSSSTTKQGTTTTTTQTGSKTQTQTQTTVTETAPAQSQPQTQSQTTTTPTTTSPTGTGTSTTPSGGATPQSSSGTATTPGGVQTPPTP